MSFPKGYMWMISRWLTTVISLEIGIVSPNPKEKVFSVHIEKSCIYKKKVRKGSPSIHKKYKPDKSIKTQSTKEHNNQDTSNSQIK
jgi:hypothetical protein